MMLYVIMFSIAGLATLYMPLPLGAKMWISIGCFALAALCLAARIANNQRERICGLLTLVGIAVPIKWWVGDMSVEGVFLDRWDQPQSSSPHRARFAGLSGWRIDCITDKELPGKRRGQAVIVYCNDDDTISWQFPDD